MGREWMESGHSERSFKHDNHVTIGRCEPCRKVIYLSRKVARWAARLFPEGSRPRAYRCPATPAHWHIGHVPAAVRQGTLTAEDWRKNRKDRDPS